MTLHTQIAFSGPIDLKMQWIGGPSLLLNFNGFTILTDPMLGEGINAFTMANPNEMFDLNKGPNITNFQRFDPLPHVSLDKIDMVLISHAHEDHFDQKAQAALSKKQLILLPAADIKKVSGYGFTNFSGITAGESKTYPLTEGTLKITAVPADHSANPALEPLLGKHGLGYFMTVTNKENTLNLYWTGDTMPTQKVLSAVKKLGVIDILIPNMGRVGTTGPLGQISMGAKDVVHMANYLKVKSVMPIHHSTYSLYLEPIDQLVKLAKDQKWTLDAITVGSVLYR